MPGSEAITIAGVLVLLVAAAIVFVARSGGDKGQARDLIIGGGSALISVPGHLLFHTEADGNVLVYPPGDECITLRFSVLTVSSREAGGNSMLEFARSEAEVNNWEFKVQGRRGTAYHQEHFEERGSQLVMHFWEIGEGEALTTVSATILEQKLDDPRVGEVMALVPEILESLVLIYE